MPRSHVGFPFRNAAALALLWISSPALHAQPDRIPARIDATRTVALKGLRNPNSRLEGDQGPVDAGFAIDYATLYLRPSAAQKAALEKLLVDQQDPGSADFHRWLTPEAYADRFGLSQRDIGKLTAWLRSEGLRVHDVARGRHWITFSGSASSVSRAFHTEFHLYQADGETHFANTVAPSIPEALADVVSEVGGLDDYDLTPGAGRKGVHLSPAFTNTAGNHFLAPDDLATIYNLKPFYASNIDGTGQKIAVIGTSAINLADMRSFRTRFNLPAKDPKIMLVGTDPGTVGSSEGEADLDLEWSGAVARNADLIYVYARTTTTAVQYAVDNAVAPIITMSFGGCEQAGTTALQPIAQQANAQGITWVASSGDVGAAGCERQSRMLFASKGMGVQSPASIPEITAVGGTEFDEGDGVYWNGSNNTNGASVTGYVPERAWNDTPDDGTMAATVGGSSIFYAKPWWQVGPGVPSDNARHVPDIALTASWNHDAYLMYSGGVLVSTGGTSAGTPSFAGFLALLNQYLMEKGTISQPGLGNVNPTLYRLAQSAPSAFHDVVNGNNVVPCMQGTPDCETGSYGFSAGPGYDLTTGLGSIDAYKLATSWSSGSATTTTVSATPGTMAFNSGSVKLTATVSASSGTPSGDVAFLLNDASLGSATLAASGGVRSATLTVDSLALPVGTNTITAVFSGAAGLNGSAGTTKVTVNAPASASAVVATATPNPVYQQLPNAAGYSWFATVRLTNESAVATTLTKFSIGSSDESANIRNFFGTTAIPANGSITASIQWRGLNTPTTVALGFGGSDAGGGAWTTQLALPFISRTLLTPLLQLTTPATVNADQSANASCHWPQPLVLEELGGYDFQLSSLTSSGNDLTDQLQKVFGTTSIGPFGRLQGTLCWNSSTAVGAKSLTLTGWLSEFDSTSTRTATASTTLAAATATATASVSPTSVNFTEGASQKSTVSLSFGGAATQWTARVSPVNALTSWLSVSPASGTGAGAVTLTASSTGMSPGVYNATLLVQAVGASPVFQSVPVTMVVGGSSKVTISGVTNAASYKTTFAPGMLMSVFGTNLAPQSEHAGLVPLPLRMQGVTATVNGFPAPLLDVTPGQLNVQIPYETGSGPAVLGVNNNGAVAYFPFQVQAAAPGIFATLDTAANLVPFGSGQRGQTLLAFVTGEGSVTPSLITGRTPTTSDVTKLPVPAQPISVTVGGVSALVAFAGIPRGLVGVTQINFVIPPNTPLGKQNVVVTVGGVASAPVTLNVTQ